MAACHPRSRSACPPVTLRPALGAVLSDSCCALPDAWWCCHALIRPQASRGACGPRSSHVSGRSFLCRLRSQPTRNPSLPCLNPVPPPGIQSLPASLPSSPPHPVPARRHLFLSAHTLSLPAGISSSLGKRPSRPEHTPPFLLGKHTANVRVRTWRFDSRFQRAVLPDLTFSFSR